jgi:uncharacterized protein YraI
MSRTLGRGVIIVALCVSLVGGLWAASPPHSEARGASWTVSVFNNPNLTGSPIWMGLSPAVNHTWGAGPPVIGGVATGAPADNFSVRFTTSTFFMAGNYRFTVQVDDGARLYVDGLPLINRWESGFGFRTFQADYNFVTDGLRTITVEMFDALGDATIIANWSLAVGPLATPTPFYAGVPWYGEFFNGLDLAGPVIFTTTYPPSGLNNDWGLGSPGGAIPADNWSARFVRTLNVPSDLPEGVYTFYARADDNFRFFVDATPIFDSWDTFAGTQTFTAVVTLLSGPHTLKVEYRERELNASLFLTWTPPNAQNPVLPPDGVPAGQGGAVVPTGVTATVNVSLLNLRDAPTLTAPILLKLKRGETHPVTGRSADSAWARLLVGATTGWASARHLTFSADFNTVPVVDTGIAPPAAPQPTGVRGRVLGNLRIREAPTIRSARVGLLPWGAEMDILGKNRGHSWYMVSYGGVVGWSSAPWIRIVQGTFDALPYTDGTQPQFRPPDATQGIVAQAYGNMRIRSGPGLHHPQIGRALWGARVQVIGRSPDGWWYKVQYGDLTGWSFAAWYRIVQGDVTAAPVVAQ